MIITPDIKYIGTDDIDLDLFESQYAVPEGMSYNSYLIQDEKTVLLDTVWLPYDKEFVSRLKEVVDIHKIDYIIMNHNEVIILEIGISSKQL